MIEATFATRRRGRSSTGSRRPGSTSSPRSSGRRRRLVGSRRPARTSSRAAAPTRPAARRRSRCCASRTGSAARSTTCGPSARRSLSRSSPRTSWSRRSSCRCSAPPAPTSFSCSRSSTRRSGSPASSKPLSRSAWSRWSRSTTRASSTRRCGPGRGSSGSTTATCGRSRSTSSAPRGSASTCPDDRLVIAESGVREPATVARWRALGFDGALVGEALVRAADPAAAARAFVAAGAAPTDPANVARRPFVKICGVTDVEGVLAAVAAGADAIGLNVVPGTPRELSLDEAADLARIARGPGRAAAAGRTSSRSPPMPTEGHGRHRGRDRPRRRPAGRRTESVAKARAVGRRTWKVLHVPPAEPADARRRPRPISSRAAGPTSPRGRPDHARRRRRAASGRDRDACGGGRGRRGRPRDAGRPGRWPRPLQRRGRASGDPRGRRRRRLGRGAAACAR